MRDLEEHNQYILSKIVDTHWSTSLKSHPKDITGMTFNDLHVDRFLGRDKKNHGYWVCTCKCGKITYVRGDSLKNGEIKSCGCRLQKHGESETRLFNIWLGMIRRCYNQNDAKYYRYGARGITVCDEWHKGDNSFVVFREWAYENGYSILYENNRKEKISIDRIDNDAGYSPSNCRWVSNEIQAINKSTTFYFRYNQIVLPVSIWYKITGIPGQAIIYRAQNWPPEFVLTIPYGYNYRTYTGKPRYIDLPGEYYQYNKYNEFVSKGIIDENDPDPFKMTVNKLKYYESDGE